jgi:mannitol/fructose-specific phosphotransferase system IIA component (Ntr-type)
MNLAACVDCVLILDDPAVVDREHALGLIVDRMAAAGLFPHSVAPEILDSIMRREELGPTGIGEGVAIPHTWHSAIDRTMGALAISRAGLEFEALDHQLVHVVFLLLNPAATAGAGTGTVASAAVFETVLRHLKKPTVRSTLRAAANSDELWKAIRAVDQIHS